MGIYGPPYPTNKKKALENLTALLDSYQGLWVCIGDFYFTTNDSEILGRNRGGTLGNKFTWAKGRWGSSAIKRRLDRGIGNISWGLAFPKASISHLGAINSDHTPSLLDTNHEDNFAHRPFCFEVAWVRDNSCNTIVGKVWNDDVSGSPMIKLYKKQAATRNSFRKWNKEVFGHCPDRINRLMCRIAQAQNNSYLEDNGRIEAVLIAELSEWLVRSEIMWRQKSRELWLKEGARNTKFFRFSTIIRRRQNRIDAIKKEDGNWVFGSNQIRDHFLKTFKELFEKEEVSFPTHLENLISPCIF